MKKLDKKIKGRLYPPLSLFEVVFTTSLISLLKYRQYLRLNIANIFAYTLFLLFCSSEDNTGGADGE